MSRLPLNSLAYALLQAARIDAAVFAGQSLADGLLGRVDPVARPAVQDLVYGSLRAYGRGDFMLSRLLERPLAVDEIRALLLVALYRIETRPEAVHTVVDQAVFAAGELLGGKFRGLVNGVLRNFLRQQDALVAAVAADPVAAAQHPDWWLAQLQAAYPADWQRIVAAGNQPPPMGLRVNLRQTTRDAYLVRLQAVGIEARPVGEAGLALARPVVVEALPDFAQGAVSVQDPGAQRAAELLAPSAGSRVLDACAAPGGKTAHLLEHCPHARVVALEIDPARSQRIGENLTRLGLQADLRVADAADVTSWWRGELFDAILLDAPCSASGIVCRHPDVRWLRRPSDIAQLAALQAQLLEVLWPLVKPGGRLLYCTCSVFREEGQEQIEAFVARHKCADWQPSPGYLLPGRGAVADNQAGNHDGFFYALLVKTA